MLKLYYTPHSCALASHIALEDAKASYELVKLDFKRSEQRSPEYLSINPKGRVPALLTDKGVLTETPAILAFVAESYPEAELAPRDPFKFAKLQEFNSYLASTVHVAHAHRARGNRWADDPVAIEAMKRKVPETMAAAFSIIESSLNGNWVAGDRYTICDPYLFTIAEWLESDGVDISELPKVSDHRRRMLERESVRAALAAEGRS